MNKIKEINLSEYVEGWERGGDPLFIYVYNNISERKWDVKKLESRMKAKEEREREGGRGERKWGHKNPFKRYRWGQQWCLLFSPGCEIMWRLPYLGQVGESGGKERPISFDSLLRFASHAHPSI